MPTLAVAQNGLVGKDKFPEFRTLSALPGGGFAIDSEGRFSSKGALAVSSPIAYSLAPRTYAFGASNTSFRGSFRFYQDKNGLADGTGWSQGGFGLGKSRLTVSGMLLSTQRDSVLNLHWQAPPCKGPVAFGVGVQDVFSTGGSSGETIDLAQGGGLSRSIYGVATYHSTCGAYVTAGLGTRRFSNGFGSLSMPCCRRVVATLENDGFNWNYGVAVALADRAQVFLGQIRSRYWTWAVTVKF